ncbi:MAG: precorrin-6A/cobalt-precorrin-6A reductase [Paracoccaceae bacterium]|nr:precorrin-6A/cobalt-precorrin-6A reductase [Paracoccaceae bacterium]
MKNLLILAGSGEARTLSAALAKRSDLRVTLSFVTPPRIKHTPNVEIRLGGFGGADGFVAFLKDAKIDAVIDATHPFATQIAHRTAQICTDRGVPHLKIMRPGWLPDPDDNWISVSSAEEAANEITPDKVVFVASGRQTLPALSKCVAQLICRQIDPPDGPFPFANGEYLQATPPFSVKDEVDLFKERGVQMLMVKNAGGAASRSKLIAAQQLGITVLMIERVPPPNCKIVETIEEAEVWINTSI